MLKLYDMGIDVGVDPSKSTRGPQVDVGFTWYC